MRCGSSSTICIRPASTAGTISLRWAGTGRPIGETISTTSPARACSVKALRLLLLNDNGRADSNPAVEIDHIVIGQAEAARRHRLANGLRLIRAVNAV